jgi:hypothetical protein
MSHIATDRILIGDGRFQGQADTDGRVTSTASVVNDPNIIPIRMEMNLR